MEGNSGKSFLLTPLWGAVAALSVAVALAGGYSMHEHNAARQLSADNTQMAAALKDTRGQMEALTAKVNAMSEAEAQREPAAPHRQAVATAPTHRARVAHSTRRPKGVSDKRWKEMQAK